MTETPVTDRPTPSQGERGALRLRPPTVADGARLWQLVRDAGTLDLNSPYAYLLWADRFAATSVVAEADGDLAGFVCGFRPPASPDVLFVWQVGVSPEHRGRRLASRMLDELLERDASLRWVEATVTPSNAPSRRLFRSLAARAGCACEERPHFEASHFPPGEHEPEDLFRIGPIRRDRA